MSRGLVLIAACVILLSVPGLAQTPNVIANADASFDRWSDTFSFSDYQAQLLHSLALYEEALPTIDSSALQTRSYVLNRLAQGYFELGMAYLTDRDEQEEAYNKGKDYALASLRLDPVFVEAEKGSFRAALGSASDVKAVFWYANNLGRYINFHLLTAISGGMKDVQASFECAIELDPTYLGGGPWRSLGSFLARVPTFMGGNQDDAHLAFANAATIDPTFIENYVDDADYIARLAKDWDRFCDQISIALAAGANQETMAAWPLYNTLALQRAQDLAADHRCDN
ncbi:MAG: TRAP transporter TatT component family protein [Candidatus Bipolaricaulota bacterium]|nr:TRAP transporter TatT component family protein [Candidatus Bipolaricaulota bacterium]